MEFFFILSKENKYKMKVAMINCHLNIYSLKDYFYTMYNKKPFVMI